MDTEKAKKKVGELFLALSEYGDPNIVKIDEDRVTILITGTGLSNVRRVVLIQNICVMEEYPVVDTMHNDDHFFFLSLKKLNHE